MKNLKMGLHIWMAAAFAGSFLAGWVMFAHSAKPVSILGQSSQPVQASQMQAIPTLPPLNDPQLGSQGFQPLPQQPQILFQPRLRTGGS